VADSEERSLMAWRALMRAVAKARRALRKQLHPFGLKRGRARVLRLIGSAGPEGAQLGQLSQESYVTAANITRVIDRLQGDGLVIRQRDPSDRRVLHASLTPRGQELLEKIEPVHRAWVMQVMSCLSLKEQTQLTNMLNRLAAQAAAMAECNSDDGRVEHDAHLDSGEDC